MKTIQYNNGDVIFKQGDFASCMYSIRSGKVGIFKNYGAEGEVKLAEFDKDQVFGEMGMLEVYPRSATAVALEDNTAVEEIGEEELDVFFKDKPGELLRIMRQLSQRLRETNGKLLKVCQTVYENDQAEQRGYDKSETLREELEFFSSVYRDYTMTE